MGSIARFDSEVLSLNKRFGVDKFDGKPGFSQNEALALGYLYEQFGNPLVYGEFDWGLSTYMEGRVTDYYQNLVAAKPRPQTVYIDFSPVEKYYNENVAARRRMPFAKWQTEFLKKLTERFVTEDGPLNIRFVTRKPKEPCIHMVFSQDSVYQTIARRPEDEKLVFMRYIRRFYPELIESRLRQLAASASKTSSEDDLLLQVFDDKDIALLDERFKVSGITFNPVVLDEEFGNIHDESLIVMQGEHCAKMDLEVSANVAAHEIGHALGVQHPLAAYSYFKEADQFQIEEDLKKRCDVMNKYEAMQNSKCDPYKSERFNDFSETYFKHILGIRTTDADG